MYVHYTCIFIWLDEQHYLSDDVRFASGIMDLSFRTIKLPPFDWQNSLALGHDNGLSYFKILSGCGASDFTGSNKSTYLIIMLWNLRTWKIINIWLIDNIRNKSLLSDFLRSTFAFCGTGFNRNNWRRWWRNRSGRCSRCVLLLKQSWN